MPALAASFTASAILASKEAVSGMAHFVCVTICLMGASIRAMKEEHKRQKKTRKKRETMMSMSNPKDGGRLRPPFLVCSGI